MYICICIYKSTSSRNLTKSNQRERKTKKTVYVGPERDLPQRMFICKPSWLPRGSRCIYANHFEVTPNHLCIFFVAVSHVPSGCRRLIRKSLR